MATPARDPACYSAVKGAQAGSPALGQLHHSKGHDLKRIGVPGPRGYDAAKKLVGRKRVLMVDAEGHILGLSVVPANVQDCDVLPALEASKEHWPSLRLAIFDGVFRAKVSAR